MLHIAIYAPDAPAGLAPFLPLICRDRRVAIRYDPIMNYLSVLFAVALFSSQTILAADKAKPLFDGKSFKGWEGDTNKTFRIENGVIIGGTLKEKISRNEFLCTTRNYTNFVLTLKFKLLGGEGANAGIQIRTKRIPNHHEVS